jgi:hypothetical protein
MPGQLKRITKIAIAAAALSTAYFAGAASGNPQAVASLNQSVDLLVKAKALLGSVQSRPSYATVEKAKLKIDGALTDIQTAVQQNGG